MARQHDAFEDRLERLELIGEHRAQFDSKVRCLKTDSVAAITPRKPEGEEQVARLIGLMEDLAKRMDILDRKNRAMSEDFRQKDRRDRRMRQIFAGVTVLLLAFIAGGWVKSYLASPTVASSSMAMD